MILLEKAERLLWRPPVDEFKNVLTEMVNE